jgi:hypothetical protein
VSALVYDRGVADELASLTAEDFRALLGTRFVMPSVPFEAELIEVSDRGATSVTGLRAPFSIVFRGPLQPVLSQGIRHIEHNGLGELDLFLVPIGPDETGMRYEAVFG